MDLPQGVWSLKDALARREQYESQKSTSGRAKRKKIIEVKDDSDASVEREVKKVRVRPKTGGLSKKSPTAAKKPGATNGTTERINGTISDNGLSDTESPAKESAKTKIKTRKPPKKKTRSSGEEDRKLPRETPPSRKSPRIQQKAVVLDSDDSGPELLNAQRQPLATTENLPRGRRKACPSLKQRESQYPSLKQLESKTTNSISNSGSGSGSGSMEVAVRGRRVPKIETSCSDKSSSEQKPVIPAKIFPARVSAAAKSTATAPSSPKPAGIDKKSDKRKRKAPPAAADIPPSILINIPDALNAGKRKGNITSKVVKIKKPVLPKKPQGPAKAGSIPPLAVGTVINNSTQKTSYTLEQVLGSGGFGFIYIVTEGGSKKKAVMKVEPQDNGPLFSEMHFYQRAGKLEQLQAWGKAHKLKYLGLPEMLGFGIHLDNTTKFRYLVIPLFEGDLIKKHEECNKKFTIQTTLLLCIRMVEALQYTHDAGYVHADIKSANILLKNNSKEVYLADFGLARKYTLDGIHKAYKEEPAKAHDGTKEYTSIDAHKGVQPSRRGDLQILGYCAVQWLGGNLPWFSWDNCNNIRSEKIKYEKRSSELVEHSLGLANLSSKPWKAIKNFLSYSFNLGYEDTPNYSELTGILKTGLSKSDTGYMTWN